MNTSNSELLQQMSETINDLKTQLLQLTDQQAKQEQLLSALSARINTLSNTNSQ